MSFYDAMIKREDAQFAHYNVQPLPMLWIFLVAPLPDGNPMLHLCDIN
jgi:hypothetical protein